MILYFITGLLFLVLVSFVFWHVAKFNWLDKICGWIVISLPFERIPSLGIGGVNIRISQILVIVGLWVFAVLFIKKDRELYKIYLNRTTYLIPLFFLFSLPSWLFVLDSRRFFSTILATSISFGALFLISNFAQNIFEKIKKSIPVFVFVCILGLYQFFGDLIGIPPYLTGLRVQYTKIVFGVPRVQGTALEPLYFAGMLFLPIFFISYWILSGKKAKLFSVGDFTIPPFFLLSFFIIIFILTISKGAIICLFFTGFVALAFSLKKFKQVSFLNSLRKFAIILTGITTSAYFIFEKVSTVLNSLAENFVASITFQFASSVERLDFLKAALAILPQHILLGIGSGQYGIWARDLVNVPTATDSYLIVNNVYIEVWLEYGLISFLIFLLLLGVPMFANFTNLLKDKNWNTEINLSRLIIGFSLIAYFIQWFTFSPIFIMPIFILLGLFTKLADLK